MNYSDFFTSVPSPTFARPCDFSTHFGMVGSCFSQAIYHKFRRFGFNAWSSPFGTLYNPLSIFKELRCLIHTDIPLSFYHYGGAYFAWETAHTLTSKDQKQLAMSLNALREAHREWFRTTDVLFITVGSAWAYFLQPDNDLVANCHKVPGSMFEKRLLSFEEMSLGFQALHQELLAFNPTLETVLTVSPVRHIREGLTANNRSKARLIEWSHAMVEKYPNVHYFPSYEIVVDELRDYRFFEPDGVHPTAQAVQFVWDRVVEVFLSKDAQALLDPIDSIRKMEEHHWGNSRDKHSAEKEISLKKQALGAYNIVW